MPEKAGWRLRPIHDAPLEGRGAFDCGQPALNDYLKRYARQNDAKGVSRAVLALSPDGRIAGYYTLGAAHVAFREAPEALRKALPAYPIPAVRLARLAVDRRYQGQGLGELLLGDAVQRALVAAEQIGIVLMLVDAKDAAAARFYQKYGFVPLPSLARTLVLALRP